MAQRAASDTATGTCRHLAARLGLHDGQNLIVDTQDGGPDTQLTACGDAVYPGLGTPQREAPYLQRGLDVLPLRHAEIRRATTVATRLTEPGGGCPR